MRGNHNHLSPDPKPSICQATYISKIHPDARYAIHALFKQQSSRRVGRKGCRGRGDCSQTTILLLLYQPSCSSSWVVVHLPSCSGRWDESMIHLYPIRILRGPGSRVHHRPIVAEVSAYFQMNMVADEGKGCGEIRHVYKGTKGK